MGQSPKVAIVDCNFPDFTIERRVLAEVGAEVTLSQCKTEDEVIAVAGDAEGALIQYAPFTRRVLEALPRLRVVSRYGIGVDTIDVPAATSLGVWVANVPGFCVPEVSDHTLAMLLACSRRLFALDRAVREGIWDAPSSMHGVESLTQQTLGLVGFGQIARQVARKAIAFGLRVVCYSPNSTPALAAEYGAERVSLDDVFAHSDFLVLLCPLTPQTRHVVDETRLRQMKRTAYLINVSRGALVDEPALIAALRGGTIAGAALDVFEREPPAMDSPVRALPNVIMSPHAAYYSRRALAELQERTAGNVALVLSGQPPAAAVNPELTPRA